MNGEGAVADVFGLQSELMVRDKNALATALNPLVTDVNKSGAIWVRTYMRAQDMSSQASDEFRVSLMPLLCHRRRSSYQ